jgi:hypothetical protein
MARKSFTKEIHSAVKKKHIRIRQHYSGIGKLPPQDRDLARKLLKQMVASHKIGDRLVVELSRFVERQDEKIRRQTEISRRLEMRLNQVIWKVGKKRR